MKKQTLEVQVENIEDFSSFKQDNEKKLITIELPEATATDIKDGLKIVLSEIKKEELELMTPFILKFIELQDVYNIKYDPNNKEESIEQYKHYNSLIAPSNVNKEFEPIYRKAKNRLDEVNAMKKLFKEEVEKSKEVLAENFKEYLDEVNKAKDEAKAKREAKQNEAINEAKEKLALAEEINKRQAVEKAILTAKEKINSISTSINSSLQVVNIVGLAEMKANLSAMSFAQFTPVMPEGEVLDEFNSNELHNLFVHVVGACTKSIEDKIKQYELETQNKNLQQQQPEALQQQPVPQQFNPFPTEQPQGETDLDRLNNFKNIIHEYSFRVKALNEEYLKAMYAIMNEIQDPNLIQYIQKLPKESAPKVSQWMDNAVPWIDKITETYTNYYNQNNQ